MKNYYLEELANLRELGAEYAREHPAVAPLLASPSTDPDVERIMEGTAFLCGLINERLDQNFPEVVQGLLEITAPSLLKPSPSQTLVQFFPSPQAKGVQRLKKGCHLESVEVGGTRCVYTPPRNMDILPVTHARTVLRNVGLDSAILELVLHSPAGVGTWCPERLRLFLHASFPHACQWFYLLLNRCEGIEARTKDVHLSLSPSALQPDVRPGNPLEAFDQGDEASLMDSSWLRNFFILPEQFLFVSLSGLGKLSQSSEGNELTLSFRLRGCEDLPREVPAGLFRLNVTHATNIFRHNSEPFILEQERQEYRLVPQKDSGRQMEIHTISRVTGVRRGVAHHVYKPYSGFFPDQDCGTYTVRRARSLVNRRMEHYVSLLYTGGQGPQDGETLTSEILCFHHRLPEQLREGDIAIPTDSSPAMATFRNILPPTPSLPAPDNADLLWRLFASLHANMLPLANTGALKEFVSLWLPVRDPDPTHVTVNNQRVEGIRHFSSSPEKMLVKGCPLHGQLLSLTLDGECYAGAGLRYLLGLVLDEVLSQFSTINTYTRLEVTDAASGHKISFAPRLGSRKLLQAAP